MTTVVRTALHGELLGPEATINVVVAMHPLALTNEKMAAPAGSSISEIVAIALAAHGRPWMAPTIAVAVDTDVVPRDLWDRVRVKAGATVVVRRLPGDLGGDFFRTLLTLAVTVAGLVMPPLLGLTGVLGALAGAAITIGGMFLVNALFPIGRPQLGSDARSQSYSLSGSQNQIDPFGIVPAVLGRSRVYPKFAAKPYTEFVGDDQYLRCLFTCGYGPLSISDLKIGETPIASFAECEVEIREGLPGDAPVTLFPGQVDQEDLSIELTQAGGWTQRTTTTDIDEISVDIVFPGGVYAVDRNTGERVTHSVAISIQYREAGDTDWLALGALNIAGRSADTVRRGVRKAVTRGQYEVRVSKTSADFDDDRIVEQVVWTALRGINNDPSVAFPVPLALIALRIKATSQLNGVVDTFNVMAESRVRAFNGTVWADDVQSRNPADLFRHVAQGPANARPRSDAQVDIATIEAWWLKCLAEGWEFNHVRDFTASVHETLVDIAAAGRATVLFRNGKLSVVWDDPTAPIVDHYTPGNSWGLTSVRSYKHWPHAFRVRFVNQLKGYAQDERVVYDDGYNAGNATLFEVIELPGVTHPDLVWRHARFHIAQARLRPEAYTLNVDAKQLVATRGDRVRVTHDVTMWGLAWGRVKTVADSIVTLDEFVVMEADEEYSIRFQKEDGTSVVRDVSTDPGERRSVQLVGAGDLPEEGNVFMFGLVGSESVVLRVKGIRPGKDLTAQMEFVDDAPAISSADTGSIPAFDSQISTPIDPFTLAPFDLATVERATAVGDVYLTGATLSWSIGAGQAPLRYDVEVRDDVNDPVWKPIGGEAIVTRSVFVSGLAAGSWSFRVRSIFANGTFTAWGTLLAVTIEGATRLPDDVTSFRTNYADSTSKLEWDEAADFRPLRYQIRKGDTWDSALLIGDVAHPPFVTYGDGTYHIKAYAQVSGIIFSANPASLAISGSILDHNVVAAYDEKALGWPGSLSGDIALDAGVLKSTGLGLGYYEIPEDHWYDVGYVRPTRLSATWKSSGAPSDQNILDITDFLGQADILGGAAAELIVSWVEISIANDLGDDVFAPDDVFDAEDAFGGAWNAWQKFAPGVYLGRYFRFRLVIQSLDASVTAYGLEFSTLADVEDRIDRLTSITVPAEGLIIEFTPEGALAPVPFKGGPNSAASPHWQVTIRNTEAGDRIAITDDDLSQGTLTILNAGVGVERVCDIEHQGW